MPTAPLRACAYPGCRRLVTRGRCPEHREQDRRRANASLYDSARWDRVRDLKLQRDPLCQYCRAQGKVTAATEVDHLLALENGGHETADANLVSACKSCHSRKTRLEQQGKPTPAFAPSAEPRYGFA